MKIKIVFFSLVFFLIHLVSLGQDATQQSVIFADVKTSDGNRYFGELLSSDEERIQLKTQNIGTIEIQREDIKSIKEFDGNDQRIRPKVFPRHSQSTRYFLLSNGYGLYKGEGLFQNASLLLNRASYGITNHLSVTTGVLPLVVFAKTPTPAYLGIKASIPIIPQRLNFGIGAIGTKIIGSEIPTIGILYGVGTFGSIDKNVSVGLAYSLIGNTENIGTGGITIGNEPILTVGGLFRYHKNNYLLTENYIPTASLSSDNDFVAVLSLGGRTIWEKSSFNYGLFVPIPVKTSLGISLVVPWVGITVPF